MSRRDQLVKAAPAGPLRALAVIVATDAIVPVPQPIHRITLPADQGWDYDVLTLEPPAGVRVPTERPDAWLGHVPVYLGTGSGALVTWVGGHQQVLALGGAA